MDGEAHTDLRRRLLGLALRPCAGRRTRASRRRFRPHPLLLVLALTWGVHGQSLTDELNQSGFPLAVGNRWEYDAEALFRVEVFETQEVVSEDQWRLEVAWEITAREQVLGEEAYRFEITHRTVSGPDSGMVATGNTWFSVRGDTLWGLATRDIGGLLPVAQLFKPVAEPDPPHPWGAAALVFPLEVGASWPFQPPGGGDDKRVEQVEQVDLPMGTMEAFRVVREFLPPVVGFSLRSEQWFNAVGLLRLYHQEIAIAPLTDELGNELGDGTTIHRVEMDLVRFELADGTAVANRTWGEVKSSSRN